jgi:ferredoxin
MKIKVNGCIGCGACTGVAPEVFEMDDNGLSTVKVEKLTPEQAEAVKDAIDVCPVGAITEEAE